MIAHLLDQQVGFYQSATDQTELIQQIRFIIQTEFRYRRAHGFSRWDRTVSATRCIVNSQFASEEQNGI